MSRPKCNDEMIKVAVDLKKRGVSTKDLYTALNIGKSTFYRWYSEPKTQKQRDFRDAIKKAELDYETNLLTLIYNKAADKEAPTWQAAAWLLERKYPEKYGQKTRVQQEVAGAVASVDLSKESDEKLYANIQRAAKAVAKRER